MKKPTTIMVQISPGLCMELPNRIGKKEKKKRITRYLSKLNEQPLTFNPNKR